jgi:hypothetical protein
MNITDVNSRRETRIAGRNAINSRDDNNSTSISRDANSIVWTPTTNEFSGKFMKKSSKSPVGFSQSDSYQTISEDQCC